LQKDDLLCGNLLHHSYPWKWKLVKPLSKLLLFFLKKKLNFVKWLLCIWN